MTRTLLDAWASYLLAGGAAAAFLAALRPLSLRLGLVDAASRRKTHARPVPMIGGVGMFLGFVFGGLTLAQGLTPYRALFAAGGLLVLVGLLDDLQELSSRARFVAQIGAALLMAHWGGVVLTDLGAIGLGGAVVALGAWAVPFTVFAAVGVVNAVNMVDGLDGLAGGLTLIALAGAASLCLGAGRLEDARVLAVLASVVVAFLAFNVRLPGRPQALVFMGDSGSLFLGFSLAWFLIGLSQGERRAMAPVTALYLLAVPLFDTVWLIARRIATRQWPTRPDYGHLHHVLVMAGLSVPGAVAVLWGAAGLVAVTGVAAERAGVPERWMFVGFLVVFAAYCAVMAVAWRSGRLLAWRLDRRVYASDRRRVGERRRGDRRRGDDRRRVRDRRRR